MAKAKVTNVDVETHLDKKAMEGLEKILGKKNVIGSASETLTPKEVVPSGYKELDKVIGVGGVPCGIVIELYGREASGKGVISLNIIASFQKHGKKCLWIDLERQANKEWMATNGVDLDKLQIMDRFYSAEKILEALLVLTKHFDLIVLDSVSALIPEDDLKKEIGKPTMGLLARILSDGMRKVTNACADNNCTVILINQIRDKIGVMFGSPETTSGGNAIKFYASLRFKVTRSSEKILDENKEIVGTFSKIKADKNRFGVPKKEAILPIYFFEYDPSPLDKFIALLLDLKVMKRYKGNFRIKSKYDSESAFECIESLADAEDYELLVNELNATLADNVKKNKSDKNAGLPERIEDADVLEVFNKMVDGTFNIMDYQNVETVDLDSEDLDSPEDLDEELAE